MKPILEAKMQFTLGLEIGIGIEKVNKLTNAFFYSFLFFFYM